MWVTTERSYRLTQTSFKSANKVIFCSFSPRNRVFFCSFSPRNKVQFCSFSPRNKVQFCSFSPRNKVKFCSFKLSKLPNETELRLVHTELFAGPKGVARESPGYRFNFFFFIQFSGALWPNNRLSTPPPPHASEKSCIRHYERPFTVNITWWKPLNIKGSHQTTPLHPVGRSINSDWCVNSFIMVVYENFF